MTLLVILMWMIPPNLNFQCWAMRICSPLFYVHWLCDPDDTCMWGLFSLFIFIIHFNCIFRQLEMKGVVINQTCTTGFIYESFISISGSGNSNKSTEDLLRGYFVSGSWPSVQPPSSPDGAAAQCDDSDRWNHLQAAEGPLHSIIQRDEDSMHSGVLVPRTKELWVLGSKQRSEHENQPFIANRTTFEAGWFSSEGMMSCVWLPSKRVRDAQLGSLRCHSPVQCCLNMIRQGSTVKRLKA